MRAANFEARFGEGATELDALEALHPGKLEEMVESWIASYRDDTLQDRIDEIETDVENEIYPINDEVHEAHAEAIAALEAAKEACNAAILAEIEKLEKFAEPIVKKINRDLAAKAPNAGDFDWPEPEASKAIPTRCSTRRANMSSRSTASSYIRASRPRSHASV